MPTLPPYTHQSNHFTSTGASSEISYENTPMLKLGESPSLAQARFTRHTLSHLSIPVSSLHVSRAGSCLASRPNLKSQQCNTSATEHPYPFQTSTITTRIRITDWVGSISSCRRQQEYPFLRYTAPCQTKNSSLYLRTSHPSYSHFSHNVSPTSDRSISARHPMSHHPSRRLHQPPLHRVRHLPLR